MSIRHTRCTPNTLTHSLAPRARPLSSFTKTNELFVGRMAMLGVAASIIGELLTGKGALAQLGVETGLPLFEIDDFILAVIGFNLVAALLPASGKFVSDEIEEEERPDGVLQVCFKARLVTIARPLSLAMRACSFSGPDNFDPRLQALLRNLWVRGPTCPRWP